MGRRKHISWKTKYAAALLKLGDVPYSDAVKMTEDQLISLYQVDHNIYHSYHDDDVFWNLEPMLIAAHRAKTKRDLKIMAKGRRIRAQNLPLGAGNQAVIAMGDAIGAGLREGVKTAMERIARKPDRFSENWNRIFKRKIRSRGFDKTKRRKMNRTVVDR
jgi:hypothetical protein